MPPNSWRYAPSGVLVGGTRQRRFERISPKPRKVPEYAPTPTCQVHALLAGFAFRYNFSYHGVA